jgi:TatD DNase family protein
MDTISYFNTLLQAEKPQYINLHTHRLSHPEGVLAIHSRLLGEAPNGYGSIGLHPWYLSGIDWSNCQEQLLEAAAIPNVLAIGEAGLDKIHGAEWSVQVKAFEVCISVSEALHKPLVIHCVRAFNEVLALKKKWQPKQSWIFHGFNKNGTIADQVLTAGAYLSFGAALLVQSGPVQTVFTGVPLDKIFLETDDQTVPIAEIYLKAAALKKITLEELQHQIELNFISLVI